MNPIKKEKKADEAVRVERHNISPKHPLYPLLDPLCFMSKNLYNYANYQMRQIFIICSKIKKTESVSDEKQCFLEQINRKVAEFNAQRTSRYEKEKQKALDQGETFEKELKLFKLFGADHRYASYEFIESYVKDGIDYQNMMAQTAQQTLKLLHKNWQSFINGMKTWSIDKTGFTGRPKIPKYLKKNGRALLIFTNQNCKLESNTITFPRCLNQYQLKTHITGRLQQVRILPRNRLFVIEVVYAIPKVEPKSDNDRYVAMDIGVNNLGALSNNVDLPPILINGRKLKSINAYYNKQMAHYKSVAGRMNDQHWTRRQNTLTLTRNNRIADLLHKASKSVIDYALSCGANTIVIGNNKDWKRSSKLSKQVNQSFVGIPHQEFISKTTYKAENAGISVILTEESYTSGTSFLDQELPCKEQYNKERRIHRGLFQSATGRKINADVNGSLQIMKKVFPNAFYHGIQDYGFNPLKVNI